MYWFMIHKFLEKSMQHSRSFSAKHFDKLFPWVSTHSFHTNTKQQAKTPMDTSPITTIESDEIRLKAHKLCSHHLGGSWANVSPFQLSVIPVSGGMSNSLFCCSLPESTTLTNGEPSQVLLRLYGDLSGNCDIALQLEIFNLLSLKDLGPKLYGKFEDGRLEEFLPANSLTSEELTNSEISSIIAKKLATIHSLDVPVDKDESWILERYDEWIKFIAEEMQVPSMDPMTTRESTTEIARKLLAIDFLKEREFMKKIFESSNSPFVFSHNDLHQGNILLAKCSKRRPTLEERVFIIDFEYCSYNYRAYDIANHFCEWCFDYDTPDYPHFKIFENRFPSLDVQRKFMSQYYNQWMKLLTSGESTSLPEIQSTNNNIYNEIKKTPANGHGSNGNSSVICSSDMISDNFLLDEVKPFFMAANLLWTLWSIKSAKCSSIKFGYWEHAMARWNLYMSFKLAFLEENRIYADDNEMH